MKMHSNKTEGLWECEAA